MLQQRPGATIAACNLRRSERADGVQSWLLGLVLLASALLSAPRFAGELVWDDVLLLQLGQQLHDRGAASAVFKSSMLALVNESEPETKPELDLYRPLPLLSFVAGYAWFGNAPVPEHAFNLALHLSCVALLFWLARLRRGQDTASAALLAAAWFALTPHLAEAHVWISGRFDLMCAFFVLLALLLLRAGFGIAAAAAYLAALLSKEAALLVLPLLPFWPELGPSPLRLRLRRCAPLLGALAIYLVARGLALGAGAVATQPATWLAALERFGAVAVDAVTSLLLPLRVYSRMPKEDYDALGPAGLAACAVLAACLAYAAFRLRARVPRFAFGVAWLLLLLVPVAIVSTKSWPGFGRYLYLPATLFLCGVADLALGLFALARTRFARVGLRAALGLQLAMLGGALLAYTCDWHDDVTLFTSIIEAAPERSHGYAYLGITYIERRDFARAAALLRKAVAIAPGDRRYLGKLGHALLFSGQREEARAVARDAIARLDTAPEFHLLEAMTWLDSAPDKAARGVLECLRIDPRLPECLDALAFLRTQHPRARELAQAFEQLAREPRYAALRPLLSAPPR